MTSDDAKLVLSQIRAKIDILRNFQIVADQGLRQQQSAAHDEILAVLKDVNSQLIHLMRAIEK